MHVYIYTSSYMYMSIPWSFPIAGRAEGSKGHVDMMQVASGICPCCLCHRGVLTHEHTKQVIPGRPGEGSGRLATSARDNSQVGGIAALSAIQVSSNACTRCSCGTHALNHPRRVYVRIYIYIFVYLYIYMYTLHTHEHVYLPLCIHTRCRMV